MNESQTECQFLKAKLSKEQEALNLLNVKHVDYQMQAQELLQDTEKKTRKLISDQQNQIQMYQIELNQKNINLRKLEDECSKFRIDSSQYETKMQAMAEELSEFNGAMASLHGELSVLQRELDESTRREKETNKIFDNYKLQMEKNIQEITHLREERFKFNDMKGVLEKQVEDLEMSLQASEGENKKRIDLLVNERETLQSTIARKEGKIKQQASTNQELNSVLSQLHTELLSTKEQLNKRSEEMISKDQENGHQTNLFKETIHSLEDENTRLSKMQVQAQEDVSNLSNDIQRLKGQYETLQNDNKKCLKRIQGLEAEKQDLLMEISQKASENKDMRKQVESSQTRLNDEKASMDEKKQQYNALVDEMATKEYKLVQLQNTLYEKEELLISRDRQITEIMTLKDQALESNRTMQKEHANKAVESNQKNSRLISDLTVANEEIVSLKKAIEVSNGDVLKHQNGLDEERALHNVTKRKLQHVEDVNEEYLAKLDGSEGEIESLKNKLIKESEEKQREKAMLTEKYNKEINLLRSTMESNIADVQQTAVNSKKVYELNTEKTIQKLKETHQKQLEEMQNNRQREIADARVKMSTLGSTLESLQRELREESLKNQALNEENINLRDMLENNTDDNKRINEKVEKDYLKAKTKFDNELADMKEQLKNNNDKINQYENKISTLTSSLQNEKEQKDRYQTKWKRLEDELTECKENLQTASAEVNNMKKTQRENERKYTANIASKEEEIQRITRRNEVLSEAVSRLTSLNSAGPVTQKESFPLTRDSRDSRDTSDKDRGGYELNVVVPPLVMHNRDSMVSGWGKEVGPCESGRADSDRYDGVSKERRVGSPLRAYRTDINPPSHKNDNNNNHSSNLLSKQSRGVKWASDDVVDDHDGDGVDNGNDYEHVDVRLSNKFNSNRIQSAPSSRLAIEQGVSDSASIRSPRSQNIRPQTHHPSSASREVAYKPGLIGGLSTPEGPIRVNASEVDEITTSMMQIQRAIDSRRGNSTPRGTGSNTVTTGHQVVAQNPSEWGGDGDISSGGLNGRANAVSSPSPAGPASKRVVVDSTRLSASKLVFDHGPSSKDTTKAGHFAGETMMSPLQVNPTGEDTNTLITPISALDGRPSSSGSGSGSGGKDKVAFRDRIREEVELGKDQLLPYSPRAKERYHYDNMDERLQENILLSKQTKRSNSTLSTSASNASTNNAHRSSSSSSSVSESQQLKNQLARKAYGGGGGGGGGSIASSSSSRQSVTSSAGKGHR